MYLLRAADPNIKGQKVQLMGSGTILREVIAGAELLGGTSVFPPTSGVSRASPSSRARRMPSALEHAASCRSRRACPTSRPGCMRAATRR